MKKIFTRTFFHFLVAFVVILFCSFVAVSFIAKIPQDAQRVDASQNGQ